MEKQFGAKILYNKVSGAFNPAYRYGLIGPNGAGKTMLMRVIMGQEHLDKGEVMVPGNMRLGYLPQECDFNDNVTPLNLALKPFEKHLNAAHALEKIDTITDENARAKIIDEYHRLQDELMAHGGFAIEAQAKSIMAGLGIPQASWEHDIRALSGGFRMRVLLTQLLLINPDFLMLDEPTNHLDYDSLVWLEKFLTRFKGGMLIISHDRDFLERVSTHTADLGGGMLNLFTGTVNKYLIWKQEQDELNERRTRSLQQQIDKTEEFIDRFKSKNTKATQAKSKEKHLEKLIADLPLQGYVAQTVRFSIPPATPCGSTPFTLQNTYVGYGADPVLCNLSITISRGNKVAIIGPNGAGKSTLLKTCAGLLVPQMGSLTVGHNAAIRYYSQHRLDQLSPDATLFDTISNIIGTRELTRIQSLLGAFLFSGDDVYKTVGVLSGGEKSRLSLASILAHPGNVLLLDEPTNHLDLASVKRLGDALAEYDGTVLIVSHDEYFVSQFVNRVIEVRPGVVRDFPGGLHDYRGAIEAGFITSLDEKGTDPLEKVDIDKEDRIRRRKERTQLARKIEKAEQSVLKLETDLAIAQKKLDNPENVSNFAALGEIQVLVSTLAAQLETNMNDWAELQEMFAAIDNGAE